MRLLKALIGSAVGSLVIAWIFIEIACAEHPDREDAALLGPRFVPAPLAPCCVEHGLECEPLVWLCCLACTERHHGSHRDVPGGPLVQSHHDESRCVLA